MFLLNAKFQEVWFSYKRDLRFLNLHILIFITFDTARFSGKAKQRERDGGGRVGGFPTSHSPRREVRGVTPTFHQQGY